MFVDAGGRPCYYEKAPTSQEMKSRLLGKLLKEKERTDSKIKNNLTGRLNKVEDTMREVFRNQQLTYELIADLFGEDCIDEDE